MRLSLAQAGLLLLCLGCASNEEGAAQHWATLEQPVIGGTLVPEGRWDEVSGHDCSGVLIASRWVLTAGHCTAGNTHVQLRQRTESHEVARTIKYPNWQRSLDVGLLQLDEEASVPPARIAFGCGSRYIVDGASVQIVGYGATSPSGSMFNFRPREATTQIVDADCSGAGWSCLEPGRELIAGHAGVDSCPGDSGGPLYVWTPHGPLLAGITSRAANPGATPAGGEEEPCGTVPGLYVRADAVVDWIEATIGERLPAPECSDEGETALAGVPRTLRDSGRLDEGEQHRLPPLDLLPGSAVTVTMTGSGDPDLYVRLGRAPTLTRYDCRPYLASGTERCELRAPDSPTRLHVMIVGYTASSYQLTVRYTAPSG